MFNFFEEYVFIFIHEKYSEIRNIPGARYTLFWHACLSHQMGDFLTRAALLLGAPQLALPEV